LKIYHLTVFWVAFGSSARATCFPLVFFSEFIPQQLGTVAIAAKKNIRNNENEIIAIR